MDNRTLDPTAYFFAITFHFHPSVTAGIVATALYAFMTVVSLLLTLRYGARYMYIIPATAFIEMLGYVCRLVTEAQAKLNPYIVSTLFILICPIALALVNYIVVGRLLTVVNKPVRLFKWDVKANRIANMFFCSDVTCFIIQCSGGSLMAAGDKFLYDMGKSVALAGLALQLVFFSCFTYILQTISLRSEFGLRDLPSLRPVFFALRITVFFLFFRNIYRILEWASDDIMAIEWAFYAFEFVPIYLCFVIYCVFHFGRLLDAKSEQPRWIEEFNGLKSNPGKAVEDNHTPSSSVVAAGAV